MVIQEAERGDEEAAKERLEVLGDVPLLELSGDALTLAETLINTQALPQKAVEDALHIAVATVNGVDYLLTWNFKHIANATMRSRIEQICRETGYEPPVICSPQELMEV